MSDNDTADAGNPQGKPTNPKQSWTIKGMPPEIREEITKAAGRQQQNVAQYMADCHRLRVQYERQPWANQDDDAGVMPADPRATRGANSETMELVEAAIKLAGTKVEKGHGAFAGQLRRFLSARLGLPLALQAPEQERAGE